MNQVNANGITVLLIINPMRPSFSLAWIVCRTKCFFSSTADCFNFLLNILRAHASHTFFKWHNNLFQAQKAPPHHPATAPKPTLAVKPTAPPAVSNHISAFSLYDEPPVKPPSRMYPSIMDELKSLNIGLSPAPNNTPSQSWNQASKPAPVPPSWGASTTSSAFSNETASQNS